LKHDPLWTNEISVHQLQEWEQKGLETLARAPEFSHPILLVHGVDDPVTASVPSQQFIDECSSRDKDILLLQNFLHNVHHEKDRELLFAYMVSWLNCRCGEVETPYSDVSSMFASHISPRSTVS